MKNVLLLLLCFISLNIQSQTNLWEKKVSKNAYMEQLDNGNILLKDNTEISLINNVTGEVIWASKVNTDEAPKFMDGVPFMYFEGKNYAVIDASTGDVIDKNSAKTAVLDVHYFWDQAKILLELDRDKKLHILNIDLNDISKSWSAELGDVQKVMFGLSSRSTKNAPSLSKDGTVIVVDKKYISLIASNGVIKNRFDYDDNLKKIAFNYEKSILYVLEDKKKLHFIDVANGVTNNTIELDDDDLQLEVLSGGSSIGIIQKKECLILDASNGATLGIQKLKDNINSVYVDGQTDKYYVLSKKKLLELNTQNGEIVREKEFDSDFRVIYELKDDVILLANTKLNVLNLNDLSLKYTKSIGVTNRATNSIDIGQNRIYTFAYPDKYIIRMVDQKGNKIWEDEENTSSTPSIDIIKDGLLVINSVSARYISLKDGKSIWKEKINVDPSFAYAANQKQGIICFYSDKKLYFFNTNDGSILESKDKFKFKDFDYESQSPVIKLSDKTVFLKGSNSVYITDLKGTLVSEKHYKKSDNSSGLMKLANLAVTAAAIGTGNADQVVTVYSDGKEVHKGGMVDDLNGNWAYAQNAASDRQAKQNSTSTVYPYVFTKLDKGGKGLYLIDANNGAEKMEIVMDEKSPNYILDEVDGVIFYLSNDSLKAFDIK